MTITNRLHCSQGVLAFMKISGVTWLHSQILLKQEAIKKQLLSPGDSQDWILEANGTIGSLECFSGDGRLLFSMPVPIQEFSKHPDFSFTSIKLYVIDKRLLLGFEKC